MEPNSDHKSTQAESEPINGPDDVPGGVIDDVPGGVIDDETGSVVGPEPGVVPNTEREDESKSVTDDEPKHVTDGETETKPIDDTQTKRKTRRRLRKGNHLRKMFTKPVSGRVDYLWVFFFVHLFAISGITIVLLVLASQAARGRGAGTGGVGSECPVGARFVETEHEGCVCSTVNTLTIHPNLKLCTDQTPEDACRGVGDDYAYVDGVCAVEGTVLAGTGNNNPGSTETTPKAEKKSKAGLIVGVIIGIVVVVAILVFVITSVRRSKNKSDAPFQIASGVYGNTFVNEKEGDTQDMHDTMNYNFDKEA